MNPVPAALLLLAIVCQPALADTPRQIQQVYSTDAAAMQPGFAPSARRGESFFRQPFAVSDKMPSCSSCHSEKPTQPGQHVVTGKTIKPMAISANSERFSDPAKVEKWFGRNCRDVVGRACSAAEKADFIAYLSEVR